MTENEVSRTLALAWGLASAPQRGPKRELSLERIVDSAIEIADAEGLAAVTMQRVAQTFDFSTMALYRYVSNKDDLHQLMLDTAMSSGMTGLDSDDWRAGLRELLTGVVHGYRAHPWALDIPLTSDIHLMPGQMRVANLGLRAMRDMPTDASTKLAVLMIASACARGHAAIEREVLAGMHVGPATRALITEAVGVAEFPEVAELVRNGVYFGDEPGHDSGGASPDPEAEANEILGFTTAVLLSGVETILASMPAPAAPPAPPELTPNEAHAAAEAELQRHKALRKQTQQRVRELEREEAALQKARDRAKELAKAHAKLG